MLPEKKEFILYVGGRCHIFPEAFHFPQSRGITEISLHHLHLLIRKEGGSNLAVVGHILEERIGIHIVLIHLAEIGKQDFAPGAEGIEVGGAFGITLEFAIDVI